MKTLKQIQEEFAAAPEVESKVKKHFRHFSEPKQENIWQDHTDHLRARAHSLFHEADKANENFTSVPQASTVMHTDETGTRPVNKISWKIDPDQYVRFYSDQHEAYMHKNALSKPIASLEQHEKVVHYYNPQSDQIEQHEMSDHEVRRIRAEHNHFKNEYPYDRPLENGYRHVSDMPDKVVLSNHFGKFAERHAKQFVESGNIPVLKLHNKLANHFPDIHHSPAFTDYSASSSAYNKDLVDNHKEGNRWPLTYDKQVGSISDAISKHAGEGLPHQLHVFSGTGDWDPRHVIGGGDHLYTPAFTSSSINPHVAASFTDKAVRERHVMHFHLPKGYKKGTYISHASEYPEEREFLLDRDQNWKYIGSHQYLDPKRGKINIHSFKPMSEEL